MSNQEINISENVMSEIKNGKARIKSRGYFLLGSVATTIGLIFLVTTLVFLMNLIIFSLRAHGPMGDIRYEQLISNFPLWAPIIAIAGIGFGIWILKKFDFSYKKNFIFILIGFVLAIIVAGWFIDYLGFNNLMERGPMRGLYQQQNGGGMRGQGLRGMR